MVATVESEIFLILQLIWLPDIAISIKMPIKKSEMSKNKVLKIKCQKITIQKWNIQKLNIKTFPPA